MSTRLAPQSFLARCSLLFLSSQCSSQRLSSFSRRRKRRMPSWSKVYRIWSSACHQLRTLRWNGNACSATLCVGVRRLKNVASARLLRLSSPLQASKHLPCPVLIVTCHPISRFHVPTVCLRRTSLASLAHKCGTSSSLSPKRSNIELWQYPIPLLFKKNI